MSADIEAKVKELICQQLEVSEDDLKPAASFVDDLKADSLAVVELVLALEQEFKLEIPDEDTEQIKTVKDAITLLGLKKIKSLVMMLSLNIYRGNLKEKIYAKYLQRFPIVTALVALDLCRPLGLNKIKEVPCNVNHANILIHDDQSARTHYRSDLLDAVII